MLAVATLLLLASAADDQTTLPRHPDPDPIEHQAQRDGEPTDPWFDRGYVAVDDPAFVLAAVENARQGVMDARGAESGLENAELRAAAERIRRQNETTSKRLEQVASARGWRLPQPNPTRSSSVHADSVTNRTGSTRVNANFILSQIAFHQNTLSHYRAQLAGKGDPQLKRALLEAMPGYQKNLELLLTVKP
jgi:predicted outer membrane protein